MSQGSHLSQDALVDLIKSRRTPNPALFLDKAIDQNLIKEAIDTARYAPNHKRTEPARFYLCDDEQKQKLGQIFERVLLEKRGQEAVELAAKKRKVWSTMPALVVVTNYSPQHSKIASKMPQIHIEDYASVATTIQNFTLLMLNQGIHTKWSTAALKNEAETFSVISTISSPPDEEIVGFLLMGYLPEDHPQTLRSVLPLNDVFKS